MANEIKYEFNVDQKEEEQPAGDPVESAEQPAEEPAQPETPETPTEKPQDAPEAEEPNNDIKPLDTGEPEPEEDEDAVLLEKLKAKGFKGASLDEIFQEKKEEVKKPKSEDEETQKFLDYQERTGRGLKDWNELNKDITKMNPIEVAKDRLRRESEGADLTDADLNYLLEEELGFDPSEDDLDEKERAKFKRYYGSHLNTLKKEQQKYNEPAEGFEPNKAEEASQPSGEKVKLSNGLEVDAATYEKDRQKYLSDRDAALKSIDEEAFKVSYDGKDGKKELDLSYKYSEEDLHRMKSMTDDLGSLVSTYQNESGEFNHADFNRDALWINKDFRDKAIAALVSRARNEVIAESTAQRKNLKFDAPNELPKSKKQGYADPAKEFEGSRHSVKYDFPG